MARKSLVTFSQSGGDWLAIWQGKIIADTPRTKSQTKPPRWFKQMSRQYVRDVIKKRKTVKLRKVV